MNAADPDIIVRGVVDLAVIAAAWSVLFFGRVKVSSPSAPRARTQPKPDAGEKPEAEQEQQPAPLQEIGRKAS